jgi:CRP-like cAMP-binding protein
MGPHDWTIVKRAPIFRAIDDELARLIVRGREPRSYTRGDMIFQQGDPADCFFLVLDGWIKLYREMPNGEEIVVALFTVGETFAEAMIFRGGRYPATAEAVSATRLLHIDGQTLRQAIMQNPQISFDMLASSSIHLHRLVEQIEQLKVQSAPKRIASFLLSLTAVRSGPAHIALPFEKLLIANRLGMKPESFSRALRRLRSLGVVVHREFVHIEEIKRVAVFVRGANELAMQCPVPEPVLPEARVAGRLR